MRVIGPLTLYANESSAEDYDDARERVLQLGWSAEAIAHALEFLDKRPLYEVIFEFYLDLDTGTAYCTKVDLGDGVPLTQPYPGEQLQLPVEGSNAETPKSQSPNSPRARLRRLREQVTEAERF